VIDGIRVGATGRVEQFQQQRLCSGHLISVPALKEHSPYCSRARKIVQAATGRPGVRGFRLLPPRRLYDGMGLVSLVKLKNLR
jgi:hypothetical protein